jgi:hypothetical protein
MSLDQDRLAEYSSLSYCEAFSHYAVFAVFPLLTAFYSSDSNIYDSDEEFKHDFRFSGHDHCLNPKLASLMKTFIYDDSYFFDTQELRFLMRFRNHYGCYYHSDEDIEVDRGILVREMKNPRVALSLHAKYMLKALEFWKLRFNEKHLEWDEKYKTAIRRWLARGQLKQDQLGQAIQHQEVENEVNEDDGYHSSAD